MRLLFLCILKSQPEAAAKSSALSVSQFLRELNPWLRYKG